MLKTIELESQKYWQSTQQQRELATRKIQRQETTRRLVLFAIFFGSASVLAVIFLNGYFENVDVVGALEKIGRFLGAG